VTLAETDVACRGLLLRNSPPVVSDVLRKENGVPQEKRAELTRRFDQILSATADVLYMSGTEVRAHAARTHAHTHTQAHASTCTHARASTRTRTRVLTRTQELEKIAFNGLVERVVSHTARTMGSTYNRGSMLSDLMIDMEEASASSSTISLQAGSGSSAPSYHNNGYTS
jgi:hypothetical protein